jgi:outer membrane protein OmpA-like peptidoglycan-associated protein
MGSKVILLLGLLASALYLYFFMNKQNITVQPEEIVNSSIENKLKDDVETTIPETESSDIPVVDEKEEQKKEEEIEVINENERVATPAFGFMAGAEKNQIVALMSDHDENGSLSKYIEELCQKSECSKDLRYENDIIDAPWQDGVGKIIVLLTDGSIKDGSIFVEGEVLKLEGTITSNEAQDVLNAILDSVKSDTFKIENHLKLSLNLPQKSDNKINTVEHIVKKEVIAKEQNIIKVDDIKEKNSSEQKITQTTEIVKSKITPKIKEVRKKEIKTQKIKKVKPTKKAKAKPKRSIHKPVTKRVRASELEILPEPVMVTTLDLEDHMTTEHSIKEDIPAKGLVAKPYMKVTSEDIDKATKGIKKSRVTPREIVAPGKLEITTEKHSEAQREIRDLLIANPIQFESKSSIISKESRNILDKIVQIVNELNGCDIVIEGYVDIDTNSNKVYNKVLSQKRADMVKRYLKSKHIKYKTIKSIGYGNDKLINRSSAEPISERIEILFISGETK